MNDRSLSPDPHGASVDVGANDIDYERRLAPDDGGLVDTAVETIKGMAGKAANKLDLLTERYACLFKNSNHKRDR